MNEPKDKLRDPVPIRGFARPQPLTYQDGVAAGQKAAAPAALVLSLIFGLSGFVMGAGIVGALVAIF